MKRKNRKEKQDITAFASKSGGSSGDYKNIKKILGSEVAIDRMMMFLTQTSDTDELMMKIGVPRHRLKQLEIDDEVTQCIETRRDAICAVPWRIEPNKSKAAQYVTGTLANHIEHLLHDIFDANSYGYSVDEAIFKMDGSMKGLDRIVQKPMQWFEPKNDGTLRYYPEDGRGGLEGIECDQRKFFISRRRPTYANPRGESLLSRIYFPVKWRLEGWGMWLHFMETFGDPIILGQVPDYNAFVKAMTAQGVRSAIGWESTSDRDKVISIQASAPGEFERLENAIIRRIQKLYLGQTLTSDVSQSGGSYAQAAVHNQVRHEKTRSDVRMATRTIQRLVDVLCWLNGFERLMFVMDDGTGLNADRATRDTQLSRVLGDSGFVFTQNYFEDHYGLTKEDIQEKNDNQRGQDNPKVDTANQPDNHTTPTSDRSVADNGREGGDAKKNKQVGAPSSANQRAASIGFSAGSDIPTPMQDLVDDVVKTAISMSRWPISEDDLNKIVMSAESNDDVQRKLLSLIPSAMNEDSEFSKLLRAVDLACRAIGYAGASARII